MKKNNKLIKNNNLLIKMNTKLSNAFSILNSFKRVLSSSASRDNSQEIPNIKVPHLKAIYKNNKFFDQQSRSKNIHLLEKYIHRQFVKEYRHDKNFYNIKVIDDILCNENTHFVSEFKEYLLMGDDSEFLQKLYKLKQSYKYLPSIFQYYSSCSMIFPNYVIFPERKYIYKNIQRKQKLIDLLQEQDDKYSKIKKGEIKQESNSLFFNTKEINSILQQTNTSNVNKLFGVDGKNNEEENETPNDIMNLIETAEKEAKISKKNSNYLKFQKRADNKNNMTNSIFVSGNRFKNYHNISKIVKKKFGGQNSVTTSNQKLTTIKNLIKNSPIKMDNLNSQAPTLNSNNMTENNNLPLDFVYRKQKSKTLTNHEFLTSQNVLHNALKTEKSNNVLNNVNTTETINTSRRPFTSSKFFKSAIKIQRNNSHNSNEGALSKNIHPNAFYKKLSQFNFRNQHASLFITPSLSNTIQATSCHYTKNCKTSRYNLFDSENKVKNNPKINIGSNNKKSTLDSKMNSNINKMRRKIKTLNINDNDKKSSHKATQKEFKNINTNHINSNNNVFNNTNNNYYTNNNTNNTNESCSNNLDKNITISLNIYKINSTTNKINYATDIINCQNLSSINNNKNSGKNSKAKYSNLLNTIKVTQKKISHKKANTIYDLKTINPKNTNFFSSKATINVPYKKASNIPLKKSLMTSSCNINSLTDRGKTDDIFEKVIKKKKILIAPLEKSKKKLDIIKKPETSKISLDSQKVAAYNHSNKISTKNSVIKFKKEGDKNKFKEINNLKGHFRYLSSSVPANQLLK